MLTVCPKCALSLAVTAEDLRVAHGYVRCGRCSSVFNALARLSEERQPPEAAEAAAPASTGSPPAETAPPAAAAPYAPDEDAIPEYALEFDPSKTDVTSVFVESTPTPQWTAATGTFKALIAANQEAAQQGGAQPSAPASPAPSPRAEPTLEGEADGEIEVELGPELLASLLLAEPLAPAGAAAPPAPPAPQPRPPAVHEARVVRRLRTIDELLEDRDAPGARRYAWAAGALLALLALLAQVVNHHRDELAASARFHGPLTRLYASLGIPLLPHWDLRAYDVRQLGASVEPAGAGLITVRASVKNAARRPQPLPLLRVTLQDRFGNRIAARDVGPRNYLAHGAPGTAFLAAGERVDAEMGFIDPGANAVGFEIDACLPTGSGEVSCARDVPGH